MKLVVPTAAAVVAIGLCVPAATAAPLRPQGSSLCNTAQSIAASLGPALKLTASSATAETPAKLKLAYTTIANNESTMLAGSPRRLKRSLSVAFSWLNLVKTDFTKAGWDLANMAPYFPALAAKETADKKQITAVLAYLRGTCHVKV